MKTLSRGVAAAAICLSALSPVTAGAAQLSSVPSSSTFGDGRPWWDPTQVIESPVDPAHAEGQVASVSLVDKDSGGHTQDVSVKGQRRAHVTFEGTGFTPNQYYTARVTLREADTGKDWGVYTWQTYKVGEDGMIHGELNMSIPSRAQAGERIVAVPTIYNADDVRRDGRPNKADPGCTLQCKRVAPLAAWTNYSDPDAVLTFTDSTTN